MSTTGQPGLARFCAWAVTFALLTVGLPGYLIGLPFSVCGIAGLVYLVRRPPRWPTLLGAPAGIGAVGVAAGLAMSQIAGYETEGLATMGGAALLVWGSLLLFRQRAAAAPTAGGRSHRQRSSRAIRRLPVCLALVMFLVPSTYTWVYGNRSWLGSQGEFACFEEFRHASEGLEITDEPSLWPPGGKCARHATGGTVTVRSLDVPWPEWIILAVLAALAGICSAVYVKLLCESAPP